ncbi:MAG: hypothetical protein ACOX2J_03220 [Bacillota bacterium]
MSPVKALFVKGRKLTLSERIGMMAVVLSAANGREIHWLTNNVMT